MKIRSNIVSKEKMNEVQLQVLTILKDTLCKTFGPMGSDIIISKVLDKTKSSVYNEFTKDGYTVLKNIKFDNTIELSIKSEIENIANHIAKEVGDGTTSAIVLSQIISEYIFKDNDSEVIKNLRPYQLKNAIAKVTEDLSKEIKKQAKELTSEKAGEIAAVATNGNNAVARNIRELYKAYGNSVNISLGISNTNETIIKTYDGMNISSGYSDPALVNTKDGKCEIRNPEIYMFRDPIDTNDMVVLLTKIIGDNIMMPLNEKEYSKLVPTVIMAPTISNDLVPYMTAILQSLSNMDITEKPPLSIITNINDFEVFEDISKMTGARTINKYIDPVLRKKDEEEGLAPTPENIKEFHGKAELVSSNSRITNIINPEKMFSKNGEGNLEYSIAHRSLIEYLEKCIIEETEREGANNMNVYRLKKRISSLKGNMVEYLVGGLTMSDRDSNKHLIEDAIVSCSSAADNGYGYASNFEAFRAINKLKTSGVYCNDSISSEILDMFEKCYRELLTVLYTHNGIQDDKVNGLIDGLLTLDKPYDLVNKEYSDSIVTSINSDICLLESVAKILSLIITSSGFLTPDPQFNGYELHEF